MFYTVRDHIYSVGDSKPIVDSFMHEVQAKLHQRHTLCNPSIVFMKLSHRQEWVNFAIFLVDTSILRRIKPETLVMFSGSQVYPHS